LHIQGKQSSLTLSRIKGLETLGFEWVVFATIWEDYFSELADCRKIHGHCNVSQSYSRNLKLATWVSNQRNLYKMRA
jgi:hypothetical protein